jgi:hypothetical protein
MVRKKYLQLFFDTVLKKELNKMFGEGSYVVITNLFYVRSKKTTTINLTLFVSEPNYIVDLYPIGLETLVVSAWSVVGDKTQLTISSSFDLIP